MLKRGGDAEWSAWAQAGVRVVMIALAGSGTGDCGVAYGAPSIAGGPRILRRDRSVGVRRLEGGAYLPQPFRKPFQRHVFRQRAAAGVVLHHFADEPCPARRQCLVETPAAETVGADMRAVAERKHAVMHVRQRLAARAEIGVEGLGVVGHVALAVGRRADEEYAGSLEHAPIERIHEYNVDADLRVGVGELDLLRDQLRGTGHRADQDIDVQHRSRLVSGLATGLVIRTAMNYSTYLEIWMQ